MNFVRGVAAALRRSSSGKPGDAEAQGSPRRHSSSAPAPAWIEIEFSADGDEKVLCDLWQCYQEASEKVEMELALNAFLIHFLQVFENWYPEDMCTSTLPTPSNKTPLDDKSIDEKAAVPDMYAKSGRPAVGCCVGHPTRVIAGLAHELKHLTDVVMELHGITDIHETPVNLQELELGERILHTLSILTRSNHNRKIFSFVGGLQSVVAMMRATVLQFKAVSELSTAGEAAHQSLNALFNFLQCFLTHIISTIINFLEGGMKEISEKRTSQSDLYSEAIVSVSGSQMPSSRRGSYFSESSSAPLMETGALNWLVELLRILRKMQSRNKLEILTLRTIKVALIGNTLVQNYFRSIGGIGVLSESIGSPCTCSHAGDGSEHEKSLSMFVFAEFRTQVLSLEVLREAVYRNVISLQLLLDSGGNRCFSDLIFWAAISLQETRLWPVFLDDYTFADYLETLNSSSISLSADDVSNWSPFSAASTFSPYSMQLEHISESEDENMEGLGLHLAQLCRILCSYLVPQGDLRLLNGGKDALSISSSYWEISAKWIVKVLIGVFKGRSHLIINKQSDQHSRPLSGCLQRHLLRVFKKLLIVSPTVLQLYRIERVWELIFSEMFFYLDLQVQEEMPEDKFSDIEPLRLEVISLVEFAATVNGSDDNLPECKALLDALEQYASVPNVSTMIVKSLHRILQLAMDNTVSAFQKLDVLSLLSSVMDVQLHSFMQATKPGTINVTETESLNNQQLTCEENWRLSRKAVFELFTEYLLTSEEARLVSLHSRKTSEVLSNLLWDPESHKFALQHILDLLKLPPTSEEDQEAKLELCIKYLEALSRCNLEVCEDVVEYLREMLHGIQDVLETDLLYYQALFREGECFVHIVTLLNENLPFEARKCLSIDVVQTLKDLVAGNQASKVALRSLVGEGYSMLQTLLIECHQGLPSEDLLSAVLDMLVDGSFVVLSNSIIQNEDAIILLFNILHQCEQYLQSFGLETFFSIIEASTANRASCVRAGLLSLLLDWLGDEKNNDLLPKLVKLVQCIGGHSISGKDIRKIFSLLRSSKEGARPRHTSLILQAIRGMLREDGPAVFFDLSGKNSGIVITTPIRWPSNKGVSFYCWVRVESITKSDLRTGKDSVLALFSFLSETGKGYRGFLSQDKLTIEISGSKRQTVSLNMVLHLKRWHFLCITHSSGRALAGGNILKAYLDGSLVASEKFRFVKVSEPLTSCTIGASSHMSQPADFNTEEQEASAFALHGQLGPVYLFDDVISADQVSGIFAAGPGYMYTFLSTEFGCVPDDVLTHNILDARDGLSSKILFGFNAQASRGHSLFDISPSPEQSLERKLNEGTIMAGTKLCYRRLLKDIIDCVGGVSVFFPLLTRLDQVSTIGNFSGNQFSEKGDGIANYNNVAAEFIELIACIMDQNVSIQQHMCAIKGFGTIGILLQSISPLHVTLKVVAALKSLLAVVANANDEMVKEALVKIHLNPRIWIYTPYIVQCDLFTSLCNYFEDDSNLLRNTYGLPRILDIIRLFYWDQPKNRKCLGSRPLLHPVTKDVIGERPFPQEIAKLRLLLIRLAELMLRDSISLSDTHILLAYIERSDDPSSLEDILNLLLGLLKHKRLLILFIEHLQPLGGCYAFMNLLQRQQESLRLLGLRIMGTILISTPAEKKGLRFFPIAGSTIARYEQRMEKNRLAPIFLAMTQRMALFPFTSMVRSTLFDMLLGIVSQKQNTGPGSESVSVLSENEGKLSSTVSSLIMPQFLGVIFKCITLSENLAMRRDVLQDIAQLVEANVSNCEVIILDPSWQSWILSLLIDTRSKILLVDDSSEAIKMLTDEEMLNRHILAIVHRHCMLNMKGGWRHVERTVNFIYMFAEEGAISKPDILDGIMGDLVDSVTQVLLEQTTQISQLFRDNIMYLLTLVDELAVQDAIQSLPFAPECSTEDSISDDNFIDVDVNQNISEGTSIESVRRLSSQIRGWHNRISLFQGVRDEEPHWHTYDKIWKLLNTMQNVTEKFASTSVLPSLGERARGLVESINIPAAEMAAAVASGGLGAVVNINPNKLIDKAVKLRAEKFPRIVFHLVLLYLYKAKFEAASQCVHSFLAVLPAYMAADNEQCRNRLQLFLWCLLDARPQIGSLDGGVRFHVISQLIRESVECGKSLLATGIANNSDGGSGESVSVYNLLQQDRVVLAMKEEKTFLKTVAAERLNEVQCLKGELSELSATESEQLKSLDEEVQSTLSNICAQEAARRTASQMASDEEHQVISDNWSHTLRNLTDERGPWSTVTFPNNNLTWWKLDRTEDPLRRRLRLKRNYHFNIELTYAPKVGSQLIESSDTPSTDKDIAYEIAGEMRNSLIKGLRGISEEPTETYEDALEDVDDVDANTILQPTENDVVLHDPVEEDELANQKEQIAEQPSNGQVLLSMACVLVSPKRKVAGRLEIMEDSIHFYGEFVVEGTCGSLIFNSGGGLNSTESSAPDFYEKMNSKTRGETIDHEKGALVDSMTFSQGVLKDFKRHRRWDLFKVKTVYARRYLLQHTALELFFSTSIPPVFFNFACQKNAKEMGLTLVSFRNKLNSGRIASRDKDESVFYVDKRLAVELAERARDRWRRREISNFEYLMTLNTLAGRTYNDLTQYPVFPWILSDYSSEHLDLRNPLSFRDLSKPVGALDAKRFEAFEERFQSFSDPDIPSFYYGSHYSSMGIVLFYLLRLEPFTSLHLSLQGGKFDHADRLFHSIEGTFGNCLTNTSDVKESIPELYYLEDFLLNSNQYYFGVKQDGEQLGDVVLPRWAKGSPEQFILKHREALESEYVSQHLHLWIDLIFGYRQRGRPALEAGNVFYHLTYEGAVDLDAIDDKLQRAAIEDQIANFGQTPVQLFRRKHLRRGPQLPVFRPLYYAPASITLTSTVPPSTALQTASTSGQHVSALVFVGIVDGKVVLVSNGLIVLVRTWLTPLQTGGNFTFSSPQDLSFGIGADVTSPRRVGGALAENVVVHSRCFCLLQACSSSYLISCGQWDNSFRVISCSDGKLLQSNRWHKDAVTCVSVASDNSVVVTGSLDTTLMVWEVEPTRLVRQRERMEKPPKVGAGTILCDKPCHVLCGHDDAVTCVVVVVELDLVVSGSKDSTCILHTLREGRYIRSIKHPLGSSISHIVVSRHGTMAFFSNDDLMFFLYSINGKHLASAESNERINCVELSWCGEFMVCGGDQGQVTVRSMHSLRMIRRYDGISSIPIISLSVTPEDCFLVGLQDGTLCVYSIEIQQQKKPNILQTLMALPFPQGPLS